MSVFIEAFADELVKIASGDSGKDVVLAEAFGPLAPAAKGYKQGGIKGAVKGGAGYVAGGGLGAILGYLAAKGAKRVVGEGKVGRAASLILPALGGVLGGLKGARMAGVH